MNSSTRQIPPSDWERHKETILELYRTKTLKDVRAEMQNQHGFDASPWKYEMQLKRWNIRKNATRKEWQQYFAANQGRSIPTSLVDAPGRTFSAIVLSKSAASKKRASRWVSGSFVDPSAHRASGSTQPITEAHPVAASIPNGSPALETTMAPDLQDDFLNTANRFGGLESVQAYTDSLFSNMSATYDLELHAGFSQALFHNVDGLAQSSDLNPTFLHAWSSRTVPDFLSPFPGHDSPGRALSASLGIPAENNMVFFRILKETNFRQELPSAQLEQNLRSQGIILDRVSGSASLGGFAAKFVAGILPSNNQSMAQRIPKLQHFLRKLESQIPGERSALVTDDQAFETKFARVLLFSMLNGLAGLDDVPMGSILRFLNRFIVNKLFLDILEQSPQHVSRTLADNIFRAAVEATDTKVVNLLLGRKLVDVNETVCFHDGEKYTPIERAAVLRSLKLVKSLIDTGADVNKTHARFRHKTQTGALGALMHSIVLHINKDKQSSIPADSWQTFIMLVTAGAEVHPGMITGMTRARTVELDFLITQNMRPENHRDFFQTDRNHVGESAPIYIIAVRFDDCRATETIQNLIKLCHQSNCNTCLVNFVDSLSHAAIVAASAGKFEFVRFLLDKADLNAGLHLIFSAAIKSHSHALIDFILSLGPDLDPPATIFKDQDSTTPIAEAVRSGNEGLIRKLEEGGCLDHLDEGDRFEAVVNAAAEAGNTAYMRKLLAYAITSKAAYRVTKTALELGISERHQEIVELLLDAGACSTRIGHSVRKFPVEVLNRKSVQMAHDLIVSGSRSQDIRQLLVLKDYSIIVDMAHEYPGYTFDIDDLQVVIQHCIRTDTPEPFKELLQILPHEDTSLKDFLETTVKLGQVDLIEYLLDMGANPFHQSVLEAVIPDRPDMLQLLFQTERRRQTSPKCIGPCILERVMHDDAGNVEALDELIRMGLINFVRLEVLMKDSSHHEIRFTPLGSAIQGVPGSFHTNMVAMKKFLDAGADPNGISKSNEHWTKGSPLMTALMVAIETDREDAVNLLLDYGADMNARPRLRTTRTALQYAAELGNANMVRLFLNRGGADVNSSASLRGGATALQFAAMSGNCNMAADLLDHGAQLDALPSKVDGMWPLEGAAAHGRLDMIRYLWELNIRAVAGGSFPDGFSERHCLRAMNFARENGHIGCRDFISDLSGIAVERLETDEYGAPWIAY